MPSWASISSKPRLTSSSVSRCEMNGSTSISPASQRSIRRGHVVAALEPAERRAGHAAAGDQEARDDVERLAPAGDAGDGAQPPAHPRRLDRLAHDADVAGRLERVVGAEAAGHLEDRLDGVVATADRCRSRPGRARAEALGDRSTQMIRSAPCEPAAGDGAEPDHARAEHHAGRPRLDGAVFSAAPSPVERPHANRQRGRAAPPGRSSRARSPASPCTRRRSRCP